MVRDNKQTVAVNEIIRKTWETDVEEALHRPAF